MTSNFYLFLAARNNLILELNSVELSWVYEEGDNNLKLAHGLLADAVTASSGKNITVVLPGEDVLFLNTTVPGKNSQRILQAIPYMLEDNVIDDADELYFAIKKANNEPSDNHYNVSAINKAYFSDVVKQLVNAGLQADVITADYLLVENRLLYDGRRVVFNNSDISFSSSVDSGFILIENVLKDAEHIQLINCEQTAEKNNQLTDIIQKNNLKESFCIEPMELCLIKNNSANNVINLLQGVHKKKKDWSQTGKRWLPVAILFLIWLSVQSGVFITEYISLSNKNERLNAEIITIYKKTFPQSRRIIDAKAQMQQKLADLKKRKGQSGRSFTEMLSNSASVIAGAKGLTIKSLRYYDGRINLEIQIASLQALDKIKDQLNKENGYQVEIQNASSGKENVTARIQITGAKL